MAVIAGAFARFTTFEWIGKIEPKRFLTHMTNELDYDFLLQELPKNVGELAYDGLIIEV